PVPLDRKYGACGDQGRFLTALGDTLGDRISDLVDPFDQFAHLTLRDDMEPTVADLNPQTSGGEAASEQQLLRVMRDVNETARARVRAAKPAHVDVAPCIELCERERRKRAV